MRRVSAAASRLRHAGGAWCRCGPQKLEKIKMQAEMEIFDSPGTPLK